MRLQLFLFQTYKMKTNEEKSKIVWIFFVEDTLQAAHRSLWRSCGAEVPRGVSKGPSRLCSTHTQARRGRVSSAFSAADLSSRSCGQCAPPLLLLFLQPHALSDLLLSQRKYTAEVFRDASGANEHKRCVVTQQGP